MLGAAAGAFVVGGGGGATALDVAGAGVAGTAVLRGFALAFLAAAAWAGADLAVAVAVGEATVDAKAEALAIGDVLLVGVAFPLPVTSPMMYSRTMKPTMAMPTLCFLFIGGPSDGPPLSA